MNSVDAHVNIIFDTDIGTDVDDALALAMLIGSPEANLVGVTTVYGDTTLRARIARRILRLAASGSDARVPCVPGAEKTLTDREVWWPGHEGSTMAGLQSEVVDEGPAWRFLSRQARTVEDLVVVAVGPLTNIACALESDPEFGKNLRGITIMGGLFGGEDETRAEHNFASDPEAARIVALSGIPLTVIGLEITSQLKITTGELERIRSSGPLGSALAREMEVWWRFLGERWNNPHDPIAALALVRPDLFDFEQCDIEVSVEGIAPGVSHAVANSTSQSRRAAALESAAVSEQIVSRIVGACTGHNAGAAAV